MRPALRRRKVKPEFDDLSSAEQLEFLLERSKKEPVFIYKHSNICGLSMIAQREVHKFATNASNPIYKVVVQKARSISDAVSEMFGIRHESPQAILVRNGKAVYDASHRGITAQSMAAAVEHAYGAGA